MDILCGRFLQGVLQDIFPWDAIVTLAVCELDQVPISTRQCSELNDKLCSFLHVNYLYLHATRVATHAEAYSTCDQTNSLIVAM